MEALVAQMAAMQLMMEQQAARATAAEVAAASNATTAAATPTAATAAMAEQVAAANQAATVALQTAAAMQAANAAQTAAQVPRARSAIDTRLLGKPRDFSGTDAEFVDWSVVLRSYASLVNPSLGELMKTAETTEDIVEDVVLTPTEVESSSVLYFILLHLCKGPAMTIVVNAGDGQGAVAWRALCRRFDSSSRMKSASQMQSLLTFDFRGDFHGKLELFERRVAQYDAARVLRQLPPADTDLKIGIVLKQMDDGPLKVHLLYGIDQLPSWDAFRSKIIAFTQAQAASGGTTEINAFGYQPKGDGKNCKDGKKTKFEGECNKCGKYGHKGVDCWGGSPPTGGNQPYKKKKGGKTIKCGCGG